MVFADEPTGNLDSKSSAEVLALLRRSVDEFGQTIIMVTHDAAGGLATPTACCCWPTGGSCTTARPSTPEAVLDLIKAVA